jgi:dihydrofolate synthase/folylpolyglutamate synthase
VNYTQALEHLFSLRRFGVRPSLDGIAQALAELGHPERTFQSIHIAGTNGKGSTAAFTASLRGAAKCRTGLYTSPHLCRFTERIRVDKVEVAGQELADQVARLVHLDLSFFEVATAAAFAIFQAHQVEVAVVECGLGGRWDATNVLGPLVSVVTGIALDHVEALGGTLESIAFEKAGIFKSGVPAVVACRDPSALSVLETQAAEVGAPLSLLGRDFPRYQGPLGLGGAHQQDNAALALAAIARCPPRFRADPESGVRALRDTRWPGRLEWLSDEILVDSAHNPDGASTLAAAIPSLFQGRPFTLIAGFLDDKDAHGILSMLGPLAARVVLTVPRSPRAVRYLGVGYPDGEWTSSLEEALARVSGPTLICGSIVLVGEARHLILGQPIDPVRVTDPAFGKL